MLLPTISQMLNLLKVTFKKNITLFCPKNAARTEKEALNASISHFKTLNFFENGWAVIEKSRSEHDRKSTQLHDFQPTGSNQWRHFRSECKDDPWLHPGWVAWVAQVVSETTKEAFVAAAAAAVKSVADTDDSNNRKCYCVSQNNQRSEDP